MQCKRCNRLWFDTVVNEYCCGHCHKGEGHSDKCRAFSPDSKSPAREPSQPNRKRHHSQGGRDKSRALSPLDNSPAEEPPPARRKHSRSNRHEKRKHRKSSSPERPRKQRREHHDSQGQVRADRSRTPQAKGKFNPGGDSTPRPPPQKAKHLALSKHPYMSRLNARIAGSQLHGIHTIAVRRVKRNQARMGRNATSRKCQGHIGLSKKKVVLGKGRQAKIRHRE